MDESKVKYIHLRNEGQEGEDDSYGGITVAYAMIPELDQVIVALSKCRDDERYIKKLGREAVLPRIVELWNLLDVHGMDFKPELLGPFEDIFTLNNVMEFVLQYETFEGIKPFSHILHPLALTRLGIEHFSDTLIRDMISQVVTGEFKFKNT